jgi:ribonucleoside-diphosphate reductase alpha chain
LNKDNPFYPNEILDTTNPCSEVSLPHNSACCLGSINISKFVFENDFDFEAFYETCTFAAKILSKMNEKSVYPNKEILEQMQRINPIGVGIMGFADALIMLSIKYDSQECLDFVDKLGKVYKEATDEDKRFHFYRRIIAPTGSLSILADCSSGIEPVYDATFKRNLTVGVVSETRDLYKSKYLRTSHQVSPEWHIKVLAKWQEWVDGGVSKTVNMPKEASVQDVRNVYLQAWKSGCKGITVYRDRSRSEQVLNSTFKPSRGCEGESCTL